MSASQSVHESHWWVWAAPLGALVLLGLKYGGVLPKDAPGLLVVASIFLLASVFAAVHHAEVVALKVGEPFGSILLAVSVTVIEVALIVSMMVSAPPGASALARDTVFSAVIIVLNGVIGLCLVAGGARHREQTFRVEGTASSLSVLATLSVMTLVLPNFTVTKLGPQYAPTQLIFVSELSLLLYGVYVFVQSVRHRDYFLVPEPSPALADDFSAATPDIAEYKPSTRLALISMAFLLASLVAVVLLAKSLSPALEQAIAAAGLPPSFNGVVIAALVLLPESGAAVVAARANRIQTSLNLALGSAIASIGLTIPVVGAVSLYLGQELILGLGSQEMVLLALTLIASTLTLSTGRATILQGAVHLVIFGVFLLLSAVP
ncbi:ionic transporter y4hA [uncultured Rhodoblastus sp.]|uniref:calcium:proton antiporter n=1 Tax=uncultured Rhodoblastus sp. TaxID=543037 RepID=UPI0025F66FFA|nr:ionic transporter y4hA [uncultured Rhodoblastus sp.]